MGVRPGHMGNTTYLRHLALISIAVVGRVPGNSGFLKSKGANLPIL
jgi:hypothetical protein